MLRTLPDGFASTRLALHRVAEQQMKPAREAVTGRFGLRATPGGFGAPPFGDGEEWHVDGVELVVRSGTDVSRTPVEGADPAAAEALAEWFAFGWGVLEELRAEAADLALTPSAVQLWRSTSTAELLASDDRRAAALLFLRERRDALLGT